MHIRADFLISSEQTNRLWLLDPEPFQPVRSYETGNRPFPPATSSDGTTAFVPNYDDGSITVIDLANERILETVPVGKNPSAGAFLPEEESYAVAVRGEDRIAFLDLYSRRVIFELSEGIGDSPFSVVLSPDGRFAFVNNTASHDVSIIRLPDRRVIQRISTGEIPIVMAVTRDSLTLWVACEGTDQLDIFSLPPPG